MNFAWFSRTGRIAAASLSVGALLVTACGSAASTICDDAGICMTCDGYGCTPAPGSVLDASIEAGHSRSSSSSSRGSESADGGKKHDGGSIKEGDAHSSGAHDGSADGKEKTDAGHDAGVDSAPPPVCGISGGPCPCTTSATCAAGETCVAGACESTTTVCIYTSQCADGDVCDDGQCLPGCSAAAPCGAGFTCTKGVCQPTSPSEACTTNANCPTSAPFCVAGFCTLACTSTSQCPSGDYCDDGACVLDTSPSPDCSATDPCGAGQICQDGYCLYTCTTSAYCATVDGRIPICAMNVCRSPSEADPQCTTQSQCPSGEDCISNACE